MTDDLSRRNVMLMTGAGVALGACATIPRATSVAPGSDYEIRGICETWGLATALDPDIASSNVPARPYNPSYIAIVFIDLTPDWKISINHASFGPVTLDEGGRLNKVIEIIKERNALTVERRFMNLTTNMPYKRLGDGTLDRVDFSDFGFATQNEVFIYFDSSEVILNPTWLLSFTPMSQDGDERDKNFSFLKARIVTNLNGLVGRMIAVRNYVQDKDYNPIGLAYATKRQLYSMNIHFRLKSAGQNVPMVIDPDTGNGAGHEP